MQTVLFSIRNPSMLKSVLAAVDDILKGPHVHPLYPDSDNAERSTEFFAALDDPDDVEAFAKRLRTIPEVTDIEIPVRRSLIR